MELEEYARIAEVEDDHWWYRNTRALAADLKRRATADGAHGDRADIETEDDADVVEVGAADADLPELACVEGPDEDDAKTRERRVAPAAGSVPTEARVGGGPPQRGPARPGPTGPVTVEVVGRRTTPDGVAYMFRRSDVAELDEYHEYELEHEPYVEALKRYKAHLTKNRRSARAGVPSRGRCEESDRKGLMLGTRVTDVHFEI